MRYIIVNHQTDIININTSRYNVSGNQYVNTPVLEFMHDMITLFLIQVRVHLSDIQFHALQCPGDIFHLKFG
ncbi:unknown [Bacteroides sp. CAG:462]|nr:unknown [Bacteroides sp. CAG:462]